jgi:hypothetical protein
MNSLNRKRSFDPKLTKKLTEALYGTTDITKPKPLPDITVDSLFDAPNFTQDERKAKRRVNTRLDKSKRLEAKSKSTESEWKIQASMVAWFGRNYRDQRDLLCANNNNSSNRIAGARNNMIGVRSGRADLTLYWAGQAYHIEVKTPDGKQSESQREFQRLVESNGFEYHIVRSKDEFIELIKAITATYKQQNQSESVNCNQQNE